MKSHTEIYAEVYIAGLNAFIKRTRKVANDQTAMPNARSSAEKTLNHFRDLMLGFPECRIAEPAAVPEDLATNPEAGKF